MSDLVTLDHLTRSFGGPLPAVEDLSFTIRTGEIFALLGPNGAGKTTTLRMIAGLIAPTSGTVRIDGRDASDTTQLTEIHRSIGVLPEVPALYEGLTAYRNLQFFGRLQGLAEPGLSDAIRVWLTRFELWDRRDTRISTFSKGMRQKVAVSRALLHDPPCVILDEPISGLDPEAAKVVRDVLRQLRAAGKTVLLSTHNLDDADRLSDRVAVLRRRLLALDSPGDLKDRLFHRVVRVRLEALDDGAVGGIRALPGVLSVARRDGTLLLEVSDPDLANPAVIEWLVRHGYRVRSAEPLSHSLEDVYLKLLGGAS